MLTADIKNSLIKTRINHYLSQKELDLLLSHAEIKTFTDGEKIIKQGKRSEGIYIVVEGSIIVCSKLLGEGDVCWTRLHCGNYFGEISIIARQPCVASFISDGISKCLFIKEVFFNELSLFFPKIKYQISKAICDDMNARYQQIYEDILQKMQQYNLKLKNNFITLTELDSQPTQIKLDAEVTLLDQIIKSGYFSAFTEKEILELFRHWVCLSAPKHCTIINEQQKNTGCFFILHGAVQANIVHQNKLAKISILGPLQFFSPFAVVDPDRFSLINYTTCERAVLLHMPEKNFMVLQEKHLTIWYKFFDLVSASFACLERATSELNFRLRAEYYNR